MQVCWWPHKSRNWKKKLCATIWHLYIIKVNISRHDSLKGQSNPISFALSTCQIRRSYSQSRWTVKHKLWAWLIVTLTADLGEEISHLISMKCAHVKYSSLCLVLSYASVFSQHALDTPPILHSHLRPSCRTSYPSVVQSSCPARWAGAYQRCSLTSRIATFEAQEVLQPNSCQRWETYSCVILSPLIDYKSHAQRVTPTHRSSHRTPFSTLWDHRQLTALLYHNTNLGQPGGLKFVTPTAISWALFRNLPIHLGM